MDNICAALQRVGVDGGHAVFRGNGYIDLRTIGPVYVHITPFCIYTEGGAVELCTLFLHIVDDSGRIVIADVKAGEVAEDILVSVDC